MNQDLGRMIEIQFLWDKVAEALAQAGNCEKSIRYWEEQISTRKIEIDKLSAQIKNLKNLIKTGELDLAAHDDRIRKLNERRNILTSSRELDALDGELKKVSENRNILEDSLLSNMEELERKEEALEEGKADLEKRQVTASADVADLKKRKDEWEEKARLVGEDARNREEQLPPPVLTRFRKLLSSRGGKAIVELNGEVCGYCNTGVPSSLAAEVRKNTGINVCTNCGRILYHGRE